LTLHCVVEEAVDIQHKNPVELAKPGGHYSHATVAASFVFVSGQLPITPTGEKLYQADFETQAKQVLENVRLALEAAGSSVAHLLQVRVYITDIANWPQFDQLYKQWTATALPCSRCVVPVPSLHYGFAIEIEATGLVDT
jgi:reactive intermediate/imine deaminase